MELILSGRKTVEIRSWIPRYRGALWLHASKTLDSDAADLFGLGELATGCYLGGVVVCATVSLDKERWEAWRQKHLDPGPYRPGYFAWILTSPMRFSSPIVGPGKRGLFYPDQTTVALLIQAEATSDVPR